MCVFRWWGQGWVSPKQPHVLQWPSADAGSHSVAAHGGGNTQVPEAAQGGFGQFQEAKHLTQVKPGCQGSLAELLYYGHPYNHINLWEGGGNFAATDGVAFSEIWLIPLRENNCHIAQRTPRERQARTQNPSEISPCLSSRQCLLSDLKGYAGTANSQAALKENQSSTNYLH